MQVYTDTCVNSHAHTVFFHMNTHAQTQIRMYVFLCAHSVSVCVHGVFRAYTYICIYLHTHLKHTRKQDTNTDMYACICMHTSCTHTRCLFIHICIDVHTYTHTYKPRYVYIYLHMHTLHLYAPTVSFHIHIYNIYIPIHTCTNTDMYVCIYTHVCIYVNICTHSRGFGAHICKYTHICKFVCAHSVVSYIYVYMCTHPHTRTNTDTYACIPMRTQCICMHLWCLSCVHVYMYIPTDTFKTHP